MLCCSDNGGQRAAHGISKISPQDAVDLNSDWLSLLNVLQRMASSQADNDKRIMAKISDVELLHWKVQQLVWHQFGQAPFMSTKSINNVAILLECACSSRRSFCFRVLPAWVHQQADYRFKHLHIFPRPCRTSH